eukprot:9391275-Alexandrium_andersonii.AAC.1
MQSWMRAHVLVHMHEERAGACTCLTLRAPELGRGGVGDLGIFVEVMCGSRVLEVLDVLLGLRRGCKRRC